MLIQNICHKGLLDLQKIVSQLFSANREPYTAKLEHTGMAYVSSWMSGKETSTKKLYFHKEKD